MFPVEAFEAIGHVGEMIFIVALVGLAAAIIYLSRRK
jgi:hypothetical protein